MWHGWVTCMIALMMSSAWTDAKERKWAALVASIGMAMVLWLVQFLVVHNIFEWVEMVTGG